MTELKMHGQTRLDADRMWRTPKVREQFEAETGLTDEMKEEYHTGFRDWALQKLAARTRS